MSVDSSVTYLALDSFLFIHIGLVHSDQCVGDGILPIPPLRVTNSSKDASIPFVVNDL